MGSIETRLRLARTALAVGLAGWFLAGNLLLAARFGFSMAGAYLHPAPRINALTVGLGIVPVAVLAWVVFLWTRSPLGGVPCRLLLRLAGYSLLTGMFLAYFVG